MLRVSAKVLRINRVLSRSIHATLFHMKILTRDCTLTVNQILDVATAVAGRLDLGDVIRSVSGDVIPFLPHDHFDAAILSEDQHELKTFEAGVDTQWGGTSRTVDVSPIREIFRRNVDHIVTTDAQSDPRFQHSDMYTAPIFDAGLRARLHVAMEISGEVIGALSFSRKTPVPYTKNDVANALVVSRLISPYVHGLLQGDRVNQARSHAEHEAALREGLRSGARELTGNLEKTRAQMGMELHDQTLADLARISRTLGDKDTLDRDELHNLKTDVAHCLTELRQIVDNARPSVLELFGLAEAVRHQVEKESALHPETEVRFKERLNDTGLDHHEDIEFGFFRIAQEAIHNAFKHSDASRIDVELFDDHGVMTLRVQDNGCGLEENQARNRGGLFNMQTRAALFGARFDISPVAPSGTCILLATTNSQAPSWSTAQ